MPTFETPDPIAVALDLVVGDVRITAGARANTVVDVRPSDDSHEPDVRAAAQTRVDYAAGRLMVQAPKQKHLGLFGKVGSIDVTIDLPAGSQVKADASVTSFRCAGRLGECRFKTGVGDIHVDHAGPVDLNSGAGAIAVERIDGHAEVHTGSGRVRLGEIDGSAVVKNGNGNSWIGQVSGDLRVGAANGDITVDSAGAGVTLRSANGDVRVGDVARGSASLKTAMGEIEIGIRAGTAARLDAHTQFGRVHNRMDPAESPEPTDETVDVRARTGYGDIMIRRSPATTDRSER